MAGDVVEQMSARLRADLKDAMRARDVVTVSAIRALIAAIDNAQAVPVDQTRPWARNKFGEDAVEVPRLMLSSVDLTALLHQEIAHRRIMADEVRSYGRDEEADKAIAEAEIIARYIEA